MVLWVQEGPRGIRLFNASGSAWVLSKCIILTLCTPWPSLCFKLQLFFSFFHSSQAPSSQPSAIKIENTATYSTSCLLPYPLTARKHSALCGPLSLRGKIITLSWGSPKILSRDFLRQILQVLLAPLAIPALIIHLADRHNHPKPRGLHYLLLICAKQEEA